MSGELRGATATGNTVYSHILNRASRIWNGTEFEAYASGSYQDYSITLVEQGSSGVYVGDFPPTITDEGTYEIIHYVRDGGSDAEGDPIVGVTSIDWDGSSVAASEDVVAGEMSGAEWEDYVVRSFKRTDKSDELFEATNSAIAEIRRRFPTSRDEKETTITDTISALGDYKLDLESDFGLMISGVFIRDSGDGYYLNKISKAEYDRKYSIWGTDADGRSIPRDYCIFGGQVLLGPVPDSIIYTYVKSYSRSNLTPVTALSSAVPYTTEDYKEIIRDGTLWRLYKQIENDEQAGAYKALWDNGLDQMEARERKNRRAITFVAYNDC